MISNIKYLIKNKISTFYYILSLNIISLFFELMCLISIPLFVASIFSPEIIIEKYNYYQLYNLIDINLNKNNLILSSITFLVLAFLFKNIFLIYIYYFQGKFLKNIKIFLEKKIFSHYIKSPFNLHGKSNPANILRNINDEVMGFYNYIYHFFMIVREIFTLILLFIIFAITNFYAAFVISIFLLILVSIYLRFVKPIIKIRSTNNQIFRKNMSQSIMEAFRAIQDIKIYNKEKFVEDNFLKNVNKFEQNHFIFGLMGKLPRVILEIVSVFVGLIFIIFTLNLNTEFDKQTLSMLALFAIGIIRFIPAFNAVTVSINYMKIFKASTKLLTNELMSYEIKKKKFSVIDKSFKENSSNKAYIFLEKVSFNYDDEGSFKMDPITIKFKKGKKIAIMGKTGSGKSTLNFLLSGLLEPISGNIYHKGKNIRKIQKNWKAKIGYVSQNIFLFNTSIKNNITMFSAEKKIDQNKLKIALKIANIEGKIKSLKDGINSIVGVDGLNFSGGERQRIAIARAIYKDPEILFLDEFTSAIDSKTQSMIMYQLLRYFKNRTIIMVTHDHKIGKQCNEIYFLNNGILKKNKTI